MMGTLLTNAPTITWILVILAMIIYLAVVFVFGEEDK